MSDLTLIVDVPASPKNVAPPTEGPVEEWYSTEDGAFEPALSSQLRKLAICLSPTKTKSKSGIVKKSKRCVVQRIKCQ
jgi:hypothetical protein